MRTIQPAGPYVLGGHSFGGRVAFEMARALERMGQKVEHLVLLDCSAPRPDEQGHDWDDTTLLIAFAGALGLDIGGDLDLLSSIVADQGLDHKLERILHELKRRNIVLPDTSITRVKGLFQVFNTNNQMTYVPEGPINTPITLFKASDFQPRVLDNAHFRQVIDDPAIPATIEAMNRTWAQFNEGVAKTREDVHLGWDRYTTTVITAYDVPGDHMNLVREPHAPALARVMRACLAG
jgi:thioesterase domain-containing protein